MSGALTDPTRRAILDLLRQRQRMGTIRRNRIKIKLTSVYVDDQEKALGFSTEVLSFVKFEAFDQ